MKYILVMRQAGDGCDYTIGCGTRVEEFEAPSRASAIVKGEMRVAESSLREQTIASAVVYMIDDSVTNHLDGRHHPREGAGDARCRTGRGRRACRVRAPASQVRRLRAMVRARILA